MKGHLTDLALITITSVSVSTSKMPMWRGNHCCIFSVDDGETLQKTKVKDIQPDTTKTMRKGKKSQSRQNFKPLSESRGKKPYDEIKPCVV